MTTAIITTLGIFGGFGWQEVLIILAVILLLFGGKKLPELARGLGRGMREFKDELKGTKRELEDTDMDEDLDESLDDEPEYEQASAPQLESHEAGAVVEEGEAAEKQAAESKPADAEDEAPKT